MKIAIASLILMAASVSHADFTRGYVRQNGTYVQGYNHTHADSTTTNNYSTVGNPYTGQSGTVQPTTFGSPNSAGVQHLGY